MKTATKLFVKFLCVLEMVLSFLVMQVNNSPNFQVSAIGYNYVPRLAKKTKLSGKRSQFSLFCSMSKLESKGK